ncbi:RNA-binding S4 domain-containing protein [Phocaeicola coprocola]|nr:pseudouridine synthase [Phocaeicola coprocola]MBM6713261.1 RNA-binding S4 domain-containing protein [Phocaeicola coprocola]MBM6902261.1 RNA-binding S4 domain-containing protein [Phocaeicola coprocola]MBV3866072.1 RNA-binding S4 domain-containing protein [Phocaeicola coprocola]MBV4007230.1 RNA-binding S4 domain-containing protein [Phocaeicola coprocola]MBV4031633.1 RNA-binding S4 domain-containing protein [Phocaeicola coprocola]
MMAERENRQDGENTQSGRDGYKSYNREGYNRYNRNEGGNNYGRRPRFASNNEGGERPQRSYNSRYNNNGDGGEQRPYRPRFNGGQQGEGGYRQQRSYGNRPSYDNNNGERSSYNPNFNNNARPHRPYNSRYNNNNNGEGGEQRSYRPRFNNAQQGEGGYRPQRPRFNNGGGQQGGYNRQQGGGYRPRTADYNPNAKYSMKKQIEYKDVLTDPDEPIRLNKFLANAGICSRREADEFITAGVVSVNGVVVTELGTKVKRTDEIKFHDQPVNIERKVYVLLNKPKDCVTTSDDPQERKTVMDFVKGACKERIYPVGRLDRNTTGVLLLTNDGDLASKLTHPKYLKKKIYHVYCDKNVTKADLDQIVSGITLDDGEIHADAVSYASETDKSQVGIEIHSGKNRIVRRIFEALGYRVIKLDRVYFAGLTKKGLRRGDWRYLTEQEVNMLRMGSFE